MFSVTNILCGKTSGNERLRYGHKHVEAVDDRDGLLKPELKDPYPTAPKPVVAWAVTGACNLKCKHCYAAAGLKPLPNELSTLEGFALIENLRAYGVPALLLSGGEPLVRPDLLALVDHAVALGISCTLSTNGLLIDDYVAQRLKRAGLKYVGISLDGLHETHDRLRGKIGSFDKALAAIGRCQDAGLKTGARFTVHALNEREMEPLLDLCVERNINRICVYHLAYAGRGKQLRECDLTPDQTRAVVDRVFDWTRRATDAGIDIEVLTVGNHCDQAYALMQLEREDPDRAEEAWERLRRNGGNQSGAHIASIGPTGDVFIDQFSWHHPCGNIRQQTFGEVWGDPASKRLRQLRKRPAGLPERCRACRFVGVCNGNLRTRAEVATGDFMGMDPQCYLTDAERDPKRL
ncbi:radical SAM/SPASM domain-containing protein [Mucisphaera calidilacus]|uniref:Anaerobic sulfatase-maturating enzyme n=1 Tax=Mucisphaera calidilacus TaxID=2527982 RepID=A0A518BZE1_9BACT|nr:radical SAM protein [Mucisphaera calidilacus]QDU72331.1 Anaerobic sulfatase-maturating enzyme [Mucisphaera calidilacus]